MARNPDRLTALDSAFLHIEDSGSAHMHVASVMTFAGDPPPYDELLETLEGRLHLVPRYRQRLASVPYGQGRAVWVDDPHFNLRYHLRHTSLPRPGTVPSGPDLAHGYQVLDGKRYDFTNVDSSMAGAAGGHALLTSTADLSRFLRAVLAGRLFTHRSTLDEMRAFVPTPDEHGRVGYGLGLERYVLPGGVEVIGHMGTSAGYRAFMFRLPAQHIDLAMVTNEPGDPSSVLFPALEVLTRPS